MVINSNLKTFNIFKQSLEILCCKNFFFPQYKQLYKVTTNINFCYQ